MACAGHSDGDDDNKCTENKETENLGELPLHREDPFAGAVRAGPDVSDRAWNISKRW
jgi:hypothetical protein